MGNMESLRAVIVGAGPGGLVALKELLEAGIGPVSIVEKSESIGGLFSGSYDGLFLTSSAAFSMFSDFPIPEGEANRFWTKNQVVEYWTAYATHFNLWPHIRFAFEVDKVALDPAGEWSLIARDDAVLARHLVVASGNNVLPAYPDWTCDVRIPRLMHSSEYRSPEEFSGQNVLVVGGGESASDITLEIAKVAKKTYVSMRNGPGWVVPRKRGDDAADTSTHRAFWTLPYWVGAAVSKRLIMAEEERGKTSPVLAEVARLNRSVASPHGIRGVFGTKSLGLPSAIVEHGAELVGEIVGVEDGGRVLQSRDGGRLESIDAVLLATGYRTEIPFLKEHGWKCDPANWYKNMFVPELGEKLSFVGFARPTFGSQFPIMEMQARLLACVLGGLVALPSEEQMKKEISRNDVVLSDQFGATRFRVRGLVDYGPYMEDLAGIIGCRPRMWHLFFFSPRLWLHVMFGPMQGSQYRLFGPGKKSALATSIIRSLPVSRFNHIVKTGIWARIGVFLRLIRPSENCSSGSQDRSLQGMQ
ncbi:NAD(P)-binding domain-containing protein [Rhodobacterales bacterium HKCCSP123]|nr:NAD(P)-binding domain-containing protein [Rhodobacterales bacterium HKCCSP123]